MISALTLAGLFGATSIVSSTLPQSSNEIKEAKAYYDSSGVEVGDRSKPKNNKIYLGVISCWLSDWGSSGVNINQTYIKREGNENSLRKIGSAECTYARMASKTKTIGTTVLSLIEVDYDSNTTGIRWAADTSSGENAVTISISPSFYSSDGSVNTFIVNTDYGKTAGDDNECGFWTYYDNETTIEGRDTLYFSPCHDWGYGYWEWMGCWPYLIVKNTAGKIIYEAGAAGITENQALDVRTRDGTGEGHNNYYFVNVPKAAGTDTMTIGNMRVYHSWKSKYNDKTNYATLPVTNWVNSGHNFFGTKDAANCSSSSNVFSTIFYDNSARAFIRGDLAKYRSSIAWSLSTGTNPATSSAMGGIVLPVEDYSFTHRGTNLYRLSLSIDADDSFFLMTYDYLKNKHTDGRCSSWDYNDALIYDCDYYDEDPLVPFVNVTVYDERIDPNNPVSNENKSLYIAKGDTVTINGVKYYPIKFVQSGFVEMRRTTNTYTNGELQIRYKNQLALIGSGSFVSGHEWTVSDGIPLTDGPTGNVGSLSKQFLEKGDVFKISSTNGYQGGYGLNNYVSDVNNFDRALIANNMITIKGSGYDNPDCEVGTYESGYKYSALTQNVIFYFKITSQDWYKDNAVIGIKCWANGDYWKSGLLVEGSLSTSGQVWKITVPYNKVYTGFNFVRYSSGTTQDAVVSSSDKWNMDNVGHYTSEASFQDFLDYEYGMMYVNYSGYYDIYLNNSSQIAINPVQNFLVGDAIYVDLNGQSYVDSGNTIYAYFWNNTGNKKVEMTLMHENWLGTGKENNVYEVVIPTIDESDPNPTKVLFYRAASIDGDWGGRQTQDYAFSDYKGSNVFGLNGSISGNWYMYLTNRERAEYYGTYFNKQVICTGEGIDPSHDNWSNVRTEYGHMCTNAQLVARGTIANSGGTEIEKAVSKYDDIVFRRKHADHDDFMNRNATDDTSGSHYAGTLGAAKVGGINYLGLQNDNSSMVIIIIASSLSILSITVLSILLIKKRKTNSANE